MGFGKQIHIHLPDGTPTGLKRVEISNWNGQAIAFPRKRLRELKNWKELARPGVYFLLASPLRGAMGDPGQVYIGESENVYQRFKEHEANKDFWHEAVAFTSKDDRITKAHVKFLESRLYTTAKEAGRYSMENTKSSSLPSLPRADCDTMEEFLFYIRLLLATLGHNLLEPLYLKDDTAVHQAAKTTEHELLWELNYKNLKASASLTDEGFLVHPNSQVSPEETKSVPESIKKIRAAALQTGKILSKSWRLKDPMLFTSSSKAAAFLAGSSANGRTMWRTRRGQTLKEWEEQQDD